MMQTDFQQICVGKALADDRPNYSSNNRLVKEIENKPEYLVCSIVPGLNMMELCLLTNDFSLAIKYANYCRLQNRTGQIYWGKFVVIPIYSDT